MKKIFILLIIIIGCNACEGKNRKIKPKKGTVTTETKGTITQERQESGVRSQKSTEHIQNKGTITKIGVKGQGSRVKGQENIGQEKGTITAINWYKSIEEAEKKVSETDLPLMIDFYADWCHWCKKFDELTFKDKDVMEESLNFIPVKLDCTRDNRIAQEYEILGFPTIVFIGTGGTRYDVVGFKGPKDFLLEMKKAREKFKP